MVVVPVTSQLKFQQSFQFMILEVPQIPLIDRLCEIPVVRQRLGSQCKLCKIRRNSTGVVLGYGLTRPPLWNDRCRGWSRQCRKRLEVVDVPVIWSDVGFPAVQLEVPQTSSSTRS